ncbi:MAG: RagB/SusD family nutrient uptake outer membrane protein [Sphingobacteriaceae bacterium]|nr:MAG: RagB/SusD family nutrient uptake outer membrane protein [Sphingobacteriaceae bacterium]
MKKIYTLLLMLLVVSSGCKKYLEHVPDQRASLNTVEKVAELLITAYPQASYITFTEAMTDNAGDKGITSTDVVNRDPWYFEDVRSRDEDSPDYYWNACYTAIAASNQALEAISKADNQADYNAQKGEALVARAYAHFMLVTLYSKVYDPATAGTDPGIPYVTEPEKIVFQQYSRKTVAYVYQQIEKDLTEGLPLIKDNVYAVPKYHFTQAAAHAFAARFYLFKKDYPQVVTHANAVFIGGNIAANLKQVNSTAYRSYQYIDLEAQYTQATNNSNLLLTEAQSLWGRSYASYRYSMTFPVLNQTYNAANVTRGLWAWQVYGQDNYLNVPKFRELFVRTSANADIGNPYNVIPLFTAEEVLFNRAEANTYLGNTADAIKDLNDYASTRIITSSTIPVYNAAIHAVTADKINRFYATLALKDGLIKTVLDFKRVEFCFEGMRWFDILRYKIPVVHTSYDLKTTITLGPNDPHRLIQLPQEVTLAGIERNPR